MSQTILTVIALFVSSASMIFTVIFSILQRKHNKNSLKPIPTIQTTNYENLISVKIDNVGTGPLTVKDLRCVKRYGDTDKREESKLLIELLPGECEIGQPYITHIYDPKFVSGYTILPGQSMRLVEIKPENEEVRRKLREVLSKITVYVEYTDVYNSKFKHLKRDLELFQRVIPKMEASSSCFCKNYVP